MNRADWKPGCCCSIVGLEPNDACWIHGWPDTRQCPACGQMRGDEACKRCGNAYGLRKPDVEEMRHK